MWHLVFHLGPGKPEGHDITFLTLLSISGLIMESEFRENQGERKIELLDKSDIKFTIHGGIKTNC